MSIAQQVTVEVLTDRDVVEVRKAAKACTTEAGFRLIAQTKLVTAASELARNIVKYAQRGTVNMESLNENGRQGLRLVFEDQGPGIENVNQAMQEGYTTGGGLGLGLIGTRRLVNEFEIESEPGKGTRVTITMWK